MEEKINKRLFLIGILTLILTSVLMTLVFSKTYDKQVKTDIKREAEMIAENYQSNNDSLANFVVDGIRITHINRDGTVLYDSAASETSMENHLKRPEVKQAIANGTGEDTRKSKTLGFDTYYYAILMEDGSIMRAAVDVVSMYSSYDRMLFIIVLIAFTVLIVSVLLSVVLTKQLVRPIEEMAENLDNIDAHVPYKELEPFARRITQQQIKKRENERMRREFTANVSHELKTPLTSISGYAEMIENGMAKPEDVPGFAKKIHNEAGRLISVIGDIIKLGEIEEPADSVFEKVNLSEIAQDTVASLEFAASRNNIELKAEGTDCIVGGSKDMLEQLLYNLCDNAIRYNKKDGKVLITTEHSNGYVTLCVSDTGIGIPKEHQGRVFERFYRVDKSRSKETGGTGLGLAIVKHIALAHNAVINIESEKDCGTKITVLFREYTA